MAHAIGGFLPLRMPTRNVAAGTVLRQWIGNSEQVWFLHNARSALHALWSTTRPRRIWLPAYVCSEVAGAVPLGQNVRYYPLDELLSPRIDYLATQVRSGDHVLVINYFGRPADRNLIALAGDLPDVGWIEDRAHALDPVDSAWADWLLYSPRKLFGVPDGGILIARETELQPLVAAASIDLSFILPSLERFEDPEEHDNQRWYASYLHQEAAMRVGLQAMSRLTVAVLNASDLQADGKARRHNYQLLRGRLENWAFFPTPTISFSPMGFPIRVKSAATLCRKLSEARIFAARHWRVIPSDPSIFTAEHQLARELVTLPCDYRYDESDMHRVADAVLEAMGAGA
jgi:hypothetical protein